VSPDQASPDQVSPDQASPDQAAQHYFTASPAAAHRPGLVQVVLPDLHFECATDAGVFSATRLDPGTRVLLETVPR
jgi:16S rRNA (guanine1207-N2)-methyltransferase